jgi:hypothetical protein
VRSTDGVLPVPGTGCVSRDSPAARIDLADSVDLTGVTWLARLARLARLTWPGWPGWPTRSADRAVRVRSDRPPGRNGAVGTVP